jgi:hypothetical protein
MSKMFPAMNVGSLLGIEAMSRQWLEPLRGTIEQIQGLARDIFPDNIADLDFDLDDVTAYMMDEGLPVAWVPNAATMALILAADSPSARRAVYGRRWRGILNDCADRLDRITASEIHEHVGFAKKAVSAMRDGHTEAAHSLTAATLDTVLTTYFDEDTRREIVGKKRIDPDEYGVRQYFVFSQVWGIHRTYRAANGDKIPGTFNRHGSVHAVSRRQYSRLNATLGIAHLTSVLWFLNLTYTRRAK